MVYDVFIRFDLAYRLGFNSMFNSAIIINMIICCFKIQVNKAKMMLINEYRFISLTGQLLPT